MLPEHMDSGLTWAWALYWSASQPGGSSSADTTWAPASTEAPEEMCETWFEVGKMRVKWSEIWTN